MKEYKIDLSMYEGKVREVVSEAVQTKAFELGYRWWALEPPGVIGLNCCYLFLNQTGYITRKYDNDIKYFSERNIPEISAADFLALTPEDVRDDVIVTTEPAEWLLVTQGESRRLVPMGDTIRNTGSEPLNIEFFTRTVAERFLPPREDSK